MKYNTPYKFAFSLSLLVASGFSTLAHGQDLIYVPLDKPCEIINTGSPESTGSFSVVNSGDTEARDFRAWSDGSNSLNIQGGGDCPNPESGRTPLAIAATITARSRGDFHSRGNLTAYALGAAEPDPTESHLNFWDENITNTTTIPLGADPVKHFTLRAKIFTPVPQPDPETPTSKEVHVTASVLGYYYAQTVQSVKQVVTVSASNADFTDPAAALASISDASASKPYLIKIGPGVYPLTATLAMKPYVCVEGAGRKATWLEWTGAAGAAVNGANNSSLSQMTVKRMTDATLAVAVSNSAVDDSFHVHHLKAMATGNAGATAIENINSSPSIKHVMAMATGTLANIAIDNSGTSNPSIVDSHAMASGSGVTHGNVGVQLADSAKATIDSSTITAQMLGSPDPIQDDAISLSSSATTLVRFSTLGGAIDGGTVANLNCIYNVADNDNAELNGICSRNP